MGAPARQAQPHPRRARRPRRRRGRRGRPRAAAPARAEPLGRGRARRARAARRRLSRRLRRSPVPRGRSAVTAPSSLQCPPVTAVPRSARRRARRADRDPLRQRRRRARGRRARRPRSGSRRGSRAAGGTAEIEERGGRPLVVGDVPASTRNARADDPRVRPPRRAAARPARALGVRPVDARRARRQARRARRRRRQGAPLHAAQGDRAPRGGGRAARERPLRDRRRGGDRRPLDRRLGRARTRGPADVALVLDGGYATETLPSFSPRCAASATSTSPSAPARATCTPGCSAARRSTRRTRCSQVLSGRAPRPRRPPARAAARRHRRRRRTRRSPAGPSLPHGRDELAGQGARPMDERAADEFSVRTTAEPSVDVNGIEGGSPRLQKTVLPVEAQANVSIRLAPGQSTAEIAPIFERLLRDATPPGATLDVELWSTRRARLRRSRVARRPARAGRVRARARRPAAAHPLRRLDPARRGARSRGACRRS